MLLLLFARAWACTLVFDDSLGDGGTDGAREGGAFVSGGWEAGGGSLVYDFDAASSGYAEVTVRGLDEAGVGESDLFELFTGPGGDFQDGAVDRFALVKIAGVSGYVGRVKVEMGTEYSSSEVGDWGDERDWDPSRAYTLRLDWDGDEAWVSAGGAELARVDYRSEGSFPFRSLRVPNNGSYQADPNLADLVVERVRVCIDAEEPGGDTASDTGSDPGGDSGGDTSADTAGDTGSGSDGEAPLILALEVAPVEVPRQGTWWVDYALSGTWYTAAFCVLVEGEGDCADLQGAEGLEGVPAAGLDPGPYDGVLRLTWAGGVVESAPRALAVTEGCACGVGSDDGGGVAALVALLALAARRARSRPC